ncbi:dihydrofolate reductase [Algoriphagus sp. H41]|uniref:Dihydrofolate reductase n=1 Tax=Algoriphagus oliviformis TaxID=2811231 RepID=A0ABS3CAL8_9BACT|nr:dihydrofolate reductase [Algoriphagus oliviformis]MBN7813581.1 dihydrofolate reductase [Algoriphagus oliviformis]
MKIILIVAKAKNNVIGKDNQLIWKLSADLKRFKNLTTGHHILMGRKTYESLGKPLPNRTHLVITRNPDFTVPEGHYVFSSVEDAFIHSNKVGVDELYVIGGGQIYAETIRLCDRLEVTEVEAKPEGDTFFPEIDPHIWRETGRESHPADEKNEYAYSFVTYEKTAKP